jgi:hypothetical protein
MPWLDTQILSLGVMFLTGAGLALALDLLGSILGHVEVSEGARPASPRRPRRRRARRALWDLALWLVVTPLVFGAVLISSRGEMRVYVFIGLGLGVAAYVLLARRFIITVGTASRQAGRRLIQVLLAGFGPKTRE